jgi:predicted phosphoribosyltransferase
VLNDSVVHGLNVDWDEIQGAAEREEAELVRRESAYRGGRPPPDLTDRIAILVDDGLATGSSMRVAIQAVGRQRPAGVVVAVPVGARQTCDELALLVDELVCPLTPASFYAVGEWYDDFTPPTDEEIRKLLVA